MEDGTKTNIQAMVSSVKSDKKSWDLQLSAPVNATYIKKDKKPWNDGEWHHLAVVYDGSALNISLYVDHNLGQTVAYTNYYRASELFALGTFANQAKDSIYAFRGKISCLRIMPKALGIDDFMVATDRLPGLSIFVR